MLITKRQLIVGAALATSAVTYDPPRVRAAEISRPGYFAAKDIAEAGFIYGLPIVINYGAMYEFIVDKNSPQWKAPFNTINNQARVFT